MKKKEKDLLGDFSFSKVTGITQGLEIPTGNKNPKKQPTKKIDATPKNKNVVPTFGSVVVPTFQKKANSPKLAKQKVTPADIDLEELGALSKQEKITFLALRGWSLKTEMRRNTLYHFATKYINRKKKRIYLGSINQE